MAAASSLESLLRRDRLVVLAALVTVIVACWAYVFACAGMGMATVETECPDRAPGDTDTRTTCRDGHGRGCGRGHIGHGDRGDGAGRLDARLRRPDVLHVVDHDDGDDAAERRADDPLVRGINRKQRDKGAPYVPTGIFAAGYLLVWGAFSLVAVSTQWGLERSGLLSSTMASTSVLLGAGLLIAAGIYQLTPLKHACLRHCRSPFAFVTQHWRPGDLGALRMGIEHGAFCTGCCWFLMALLFYGGIVNLYWIIGLAVYVLLERPFRPVTGSAVSPVCC